MVMGILVIVKKKGEKSPSQLKDTDGDCLYEMGHDPWLSVSVTHFADPFTPTSFIGHFVTV